MLVIGFVTIGLLLVSHAINRSRSAEALLLVPFGVGSVLLPLFGTVSFFQLRSGHLLLALFLAFEWLVLTSMGLLYDAMKRQSRHSPARSLRLLSYGPVLRWCALLFSVILAFYALGVASQIVAAPSIADYFLAKRAQAHAGEGVDVSNPFAYRAINFSMALVLLMSSWRHFARNEPALRGRAIFFTLLIIGSVASLLEGNRSTLIVTLIALMCFVYINRLVTTRRIFILFAIFVLFFVLSMQVLRLEGDFSLRGLQLAFSWFTVYAFGSLASFADFFDHEILTFWYTFDIAALKFGDEFVQAVGAREFFIIDYVDIGDLSTNVYSGYAVLYDYLGAWAALYLVVKSCIFYFLKWTSQRSFIGNACYIAVLSSYPLTIYHEFMLTTMYYCLNILELASVFWLLAYIVRVGKGNRVLLSPIAIAQKLES